LPIVTRWTLLNARSAFSPVKSMNELTVAQQGVRGIVA
jgi:hypothetical protein